MEWSSGVRRQVSALLRNAKRVDDERLALVLEAQVIDLVASMTDQVNFELKRNRLTRSHPTGQVVNVPTGEVL